ncbi:bile acid:sodium symporter family protein [Rubrobacter taiwanensis]|uniref:Bile acid:sodium symporter family protein n=1 Tax=Rubrobacter taiwanensis TaxID=185139 RepID=A0A4R1BRS0_9ACTN|nr:bile acid:sodium symporter [Rubrobacter taiwanensis]TCJ20047.1 bile acid:sodium symporter family protein [Rubrobacter taiwanensis]
MAKALGHLKVLEENLLLFVLATAALGLAFPVLGEALYPAVTLLLALLMLCVSLTFDFGAVRRVLGRPSYQLAATLLVYGPMSLAGLLIGRLFFGSGPLATGQVLVGVLPTDVSAPLLVLLGRGNVALAAVLNAVNTALAPFVVPLLLLLLTGVRFEVPVGLLILELCLVILVPMAAGILLRTRYPAATSRFDPVYSFGSSLTYLLLLLAVIGPNAGIILDYGPYALVILLAQIALNAAGYGFGAAMRWFAGSREDQIAFLFTVSKKEFTIAAAVVVASGLPGEILVPAVFYAVVQMITSPLVVRILNR